MMKPELKNRKVLIIVENLPVPFDRRVWQEATTLAANGYEVSIICPTGLGFNAKYEVIGGIHIYRHNLPVEADGMLGYVFEYSAALFWEFTLAWRVLMTRGFDVIHACNPPDNLFIIGLFFKLLGKKYLFDHHDINPELYEAKFGRKGLLYKLMLLLERCNFSVADVSVATNESFKNIAIQRGGMRPDKVFVVRSGPDMGRIKIIPAVEALKKNRRYLVGYVGIMGKQDGVDYLIRAANHIIKNIGRKDVHFGLIGGGTELESLKAYAEELGIAEYFTFTGLISDVKQLLEMLNTADVCVGTDIANSMNDKSTMNKTMEYMALAKPIVQFDLTEGRVTAQEASLYAAKNDEIDMANKILQLLDDPEACARMGAYGYNRIINELEWKYEVPKLLAAYDALWD